MAKKAKKETRPTEPRPSEVQKQQQPAPPPSNTPPPPPSLWPLFFHSDAQRGIQLVVLAAIYSHISQLCLSPVYGGVPSALYHQYGSYAAVMLPVLLRGQAQPYVPRRMAETLPTFAFWIPSIQFMLFKYSSTLGVPYGPLITELLTYYPLVVLSIYVSGTYFDRLDLSRFDSAVAEIGPSFVAFVTFFFSKRVLKAFFLKNIGSNLMMTRVGLQIIVGSLYALLVPSSFFAASIPSVAFTMLANVHNPFQRTTDVLNGTLALQGYTLIDRQESITGYLSVLESTTEHFRVMRCDHSLLGGEWTMAPPDGRVALVKEPIYGVFAMLEAVRLVESAGPPKPDSDKTALNIGLGIGTAPTALIKHGISTTIIELDPVVHLFARHHFGLPNHTYVIGDAASVVESWSQPAAAAAAHETYDIILHDCFSAGGVPPDLFTVEFFTSLATLLRADGVVAINYAGDLASPAAALVYRTVAAVFPACRVFRETAPPSPDADEEADLTNMVIFCTKTPGPIAFRKPVEADCLGSGARRQFLALDHEIPAARFERAGDVLRRGRTRELERWQAQSALEHWRVMRRVLPASVWENW